MTTRELCGQVADEDRERKVSRSKYSWRSLLVAYLRAGAGPLERRRRSLEYSNIIQTMKSQMMRNFDDGTIQILYYF